MNTEKLSAVLGAVMFFSMPAAAIANIVEIWTESGVAYRCKWTALTVFMMAFIMGLLIQTGYESSKK